MGEVISMAKLGSAGSASWSWCIPAGSSKMRMVVVLCMTSDGMRFLPSRILAPATFRHLATEYVELAPWAAEIKLAESSLARRLSRFRTPPGLAQLARIVESLHDMLAAARFLPVSEIPCEPSDQPILETDAYIGRSILVRPSGSREHIAAWITSAQEPVDLVCLDLEGQPRRFVADLTCLMEDETMPPSHASRRMEERD